MRAEAVAAGEAMARIVALARMTVAEVVRGGRVPTAHGNL